MFVNLLRSGIVSYVYYRDEAHILSSTVREGCAALLVKFDDAVVIAWQSN